MIEIVKVTNGTGVLNKAEMNEVLAKLSSKNLNPEELDFIIPNASDKLDMGLSDDEDFANFRHVMF